MSFENVPLLLLNILDIQNLVDHFMPLLQKETKVMVVKNDGTVEVFGAVRRFSDGDGNFNLEVVKTHVMLLGRLAAELPKVSQSNSQLPDIQQRFDTCIWELAKKDAGLITTMTPHEELSIALWMYGCAILHNVVNGAVETMSQPPQLIEAASVFKLLFDRGAKEHVANFNEMAPAYTKSYVCKAMEDIACGLYCSVAGNTHAVEYNASNELFVSLRPALQFWMKAARFFDDAAVVSMNNEGHDVLAVPVIAAFQNVAKISNAFAGLQWALEYVPSDPTLALDYLEHNIPELTSDNKQKSMFTAALDSKIALHGSERTKRNYFMTWIMGKSSPTLPPFVYNDSFTHGLENLTPAIGLIFPNAQ